MMEKEPLVSIIIPTYNSDATIDLCLHSIVKQTYQNLEVIVVDNCSSDSTLEKVQRYKVCVVSRKTGMSEAKNIGVELAKGDFFFFVDSDMELSFDVVELCIKKSVNERFDVLIVPEVTVGDTFWTKCRAWAGMPYARANRFMRRKVFKEVGDFDAQLLAGEDYDYEHRIRNRGYRIGCVGSFIKHHENFRLKEIITKKYRYSKTLDLYAKKYSRNFVRDFFPFKFSCLKTTKMSSWSPLLAIGYAIVMIVIYFTAIVGIVVSLIDESR